MIRLVFRTSQYVILTSRFRPIWRIGRTGETLGIGYTDFKIFKAGCFLIWGIKFIFVCYEPEFQKKGDFRRSETLNSVFFKLQNFKKVCFLV